MSPAPALHHIGLACRHSSSPETAAAAAADLVSVVPVPISGQWPPLASDPCLAVASRKLSLAEGRIQRVRACMRFAGWYLKIAAVGASIGAAMELFMIHTGFYDKVVILEAEKRALESSPEAQAMREALNPWRKHDDEEPKKQS